MRISIEYLYTVSWLPQPSCDREATLGLVKRPMQYLFRGCSWGLLDKVLGNELNIESSPLGPRQTEKKSAWEWQMAQNAQRRCVYERLRCSESASISHRLVLRIIRPIRCYIVFVREEKVGFGRRRDCRRHEVC